MYWRAGGLLACPLWDLLGSVMCQESQRDAVSVVGLLRKWGKFCRFVQLLLKIHERIYLFFFTSLSSFQKLLFQPCAIWC